MKEITLKYLMPRIPSFKVYQSLEPTRLTMTSY